MMAEPGRLKIGGPIRVVCEAPDGTIKWVSEGHNAWTNAGLTHLLNIVLRAGTQVATWYMGLVDNAGFTQFAAADTMASHAGWAESSAYSESVRQTWTPAAPSSNTVVNSSEVVFTCNTASTVIRGIFITSANDKGGSTGTLLMTAALTDGNQTLNSGDKIKLTYSVPATAA